MKLLFSVVTVLILSNLAQASEGLRLHCLPIGFDGTPEIKAEIAGDNVLDNVTEAYMFEQGEMEPSKLGRIVAEPSSSDYALRLFVLSSDKVGKEYLLLPKNLSELTKGSKFKAEFTDIGLDPQTGTSHRTLNCSVN